MRVGNNHLPQLDRTNEGKAGAARSVDGGQRATETSGEGGVQAKRAPGQRTETIRKLAQQLAQQLSTEGREERSGGTERARELMARPVDSQLATQIAAHLLRGETVPSPARDLVD